MHVALRMADFFQYNTIQYSFNGAWQNASYTIIILKMEKYKETIESSESG